MMRTKLKLKSCAIEFSQQVLLIGTRKREPDCHCVFQSFGRTASCRGLRCTSCKCLSIAVLQLSDACMVLSQPQELEHGQ